MNINTYKSPKFLATRLGLNSSNYYQFHKAVFGVVSGKDSLSDTSSEVEDVQPEFSGTTNIHATTKNQLLVPTESQNRRLYFLVPFGWTQMAVTKNLAKFEPIDYILYLTMKNTRGLHGIIKFICAEDAQMALKHEFCAKYLKARWSLPMSKKEEYAKHDICGHQITVRERTNHLLICDL